MSCRRVHTSPVPSKGGLFSAVMVLVLAFVAVLPQDAMGAAKNRPAYITVNSINDCAPKLTTTASEVSLLRIILALYRGIGIGQCNLETNFKNNTSACTLCSARLRAPNV